MRRLYLEMLRAADRGARRRLRRDPEGASSIACLHRATNTGLPLPGREGDHVPQSKIVIALPAAASSGRGSGPAAPSYQLFRSLPRSFTGVPRGAATVMAKYTLSGRVAVHFFVEASTTVCAVP